MVSQDSLISITKKELRAYFNNPTAYIALIVFLILWQFLFFRDAFLVGESSLRFLFELLPWLFLILIPALTMGSISQEKSQGTLELLLTRPVNDQELLAGKFLASVLFTSLALLFVVPMAVSFNHFGALDWGVVAGQYLGAVFLAAVLVSLGVFVSSFFESQISALLVAAAGSFFLVVAGSGLVTASLPFWLANFLEQLSVTSHFVAMARGVIDLRDVWYFVSVIVVLLGLAYLQLLKRRFGNRRRDYQSYQAGMVLLIGIVVLTNVLGSRIPGRIDLTQERLYTLTSATQKVLGNLSDVVNIVVFASKELPAQFQPNLRNVKDTLRDYQTLGQGNIVVSFKDPADDPSVAQEAMSLGIREVQFNVIGQEELRLKNGYLGLAVQFGGESESLPFIEDTSDLEYQLTSFIKQLTTTDKQKIGFLTGHGEKSIYQDYRWLNQELKKTFEIQEVSLTEEQPGIPDDVRVLVVAGPTEEIDAATRTALQEFVESSKALLFMVDPVIVNPQGLLASPNPNSLADFVGQYGVTINSDLVYDLRSNQTVSFGGGLINYLLPYPFWLQAVATEPRSPVNAKLDRLVLPWPSSISLDQDRIEGLGYNAMPLFITTRFGGVQTDSFSLAPDQRFPETGLGEQIVVVSLAGSAEGSVPKARLVVVGNSNFLADQFMQNSPENLAFGIEALSWLSQEESLAGIALKQQVIRQLQFDNNSQVAMVKYGNLGLAFLLPAGVALFRLNRRRNLRKFKYFSTT